MLQTVDEKPQVGIVTESRLEELATDYEDRTMLVLKPLLKQLGSQLSDIEAIKTALRETQIKIDDLKTHSEVLDVSSKEFATKLEGFKGELINSNALITLQENPINEIKQTVSSMSFTVNTIAAEVDKMKSLRDDVGKMVNTLKWWLFGIVATFVINAILSKIFHI